LGWTHVCERPLQQGLLAPVGAWDWVTGQGFHLVWSASVEMSTHAALARDWILAGAEG
jgi:hypothetical protein